MKYDPEIDPSIREAQEEAEREREMSARIRLEIERFVAENDLVPRQEAAAEADETDDTGDAGNVAEEPAEKSRRDRKREEKEAKAREKEAKREASKERKARRAESGRRAFQSIFTGSIIENEQIRKLWPYLAGLALLMLLYIANVFHLQRLHRTQQRLEEDIRELSIKAVDFSAERAQQTQRSAIVRKLEDKNIPLREYPYPLKTVDGK